MTIERVSSPHPSGGDKMTKEAFQEESDVNVLIRRWVPGSVLPGQVLRPEHFGDFTGLDDFHQALSRVRQVEATFETLPAHVRKHFKNDPAQLVAACTDPKRVDELVELGLAERPKEVKVDGIDKAGAGAGRAPAAEKPRGSGKSDRESSAGDPPKDGEGS